MLNRKFSSLDEFLAYCRGFMRVRRLSLRTEASYLYYIRCYIQYFKRKPQDMGTAEVEAFLTHLAVDENVAASTQNVAFCALLYLYRNILGIDLDHIAAMRARPSRRAPVVLSRAEVTRLLAHVEEPHRLILELLYGAGLRVREGLQLRVQDVDFHQRLLIIHAGKGDQDRHAILPDKLHRPLRAHLATAREQWQTQQQQHPLPVSMPHALARKYPRAPFEWPWQFVFPAAEASIDPRDGCLKRYN